MTDRLVDLGFGLAWRAARMLPEAGAERLFRRVADAVWRRDGDGVRRLHSNLRRVVGPELPEPELRALTRDAMRSYCRYWLEVFRLPSYGRRQILDRFTLDGWEVFDAHREAGTGVVLAIPHSGNWDLAGAWVCAKGYPLTTVAERLTADGVYRKFLDFRRGLGMEILPHTGGERPALAVLVERVRAGHIVPLVADRDLSDAGVEVEFFGGRTRMPGGPAYLALRTGAPLYTVVLHYDGPRHCYGKIEGPIEFPATGRLAQRMAAGTQAVADAFAAGIAAQPADWHMLQPLWLDDPAVTNA